MKRILNLFLFVVLVIASAAFTFWLSNESGLIYKNPSEAITPRLEEKSMAEIMDHFIKDIDKHADAYRDIRTKPSELLQPSALTSADAIAENAKALDKIIDQQSRESAALMEVFTNTDDKVDLFCVGKSKDEIARIRDQWQNLKDKQMASYVDFFSYEEDMRDTEKNLMKLYQDNAAKLHYDAAQNQTVFDDAANKNKETDFRKALKKFTEDQLEAMKTENPGGQAKGLNLTAPAPLSSAPELKAQPSDDNSK